MMKALSLFIFSFPYCCVKCENSSTTEHVRNSICFFCPCSHAHQKHNCGWRRTILSGCLVLCCLCHHRPSTITRRAPGPIPCTNDVAQCVTGDQGKAGLNGGGARPTGDAGKNRRRLGARVQCVHRQGCDVGMTEAFERAKHLALCVIMNGDISVEAVEQLSGAIHPKHQCLPVLEIFLLINPTVWLTTRSAIHSPVSQASYQLKQVAFHAPAVTNRDSIRSARIAYPFQLSMDQLS